MERKIKLPKINPEKVADEIGNFVVETVNRVRATGGIIGLSGGVDSTTTAILVKRAFDKYNKKNHNKLELVGYMLPSKLNNSKDTEDSIDVAKRLKLRYETHYIDPIVESYYEINPEIFQINHTYDKGNLISRVRANVLSTKAAFEKKIVLGTGNKDEDFGVGYYTLFGDGAVHLSPIGNLSKRLVRDVAEYFGFGDIAKKVSTAGLEPGQTDFKDLGYNYDTVELVMEGLGQGFNLEELVEDKDVIATLEPQLKITNKFRTIREAVKDIWNRHHNIALPKMEIIHPPAAPVTMEYQNGI